MYEPCVTPTKYVQKLCPNFCALFRTEQCPTPAHGKWECDRHMRLIDGEEQDCRTFRCALFVGNTSYKFLQANKAMGNGDQNRELLNKHYGIDMPPRRGKRI